MGVVDPSLGTFIFSDATTGGPVDVTITYTSPSGTMVSGTYTINVTGLILTPTSPVGIVAGTSHTITASGTPSSGIVSIVGSDPGTTAGSFILTSSGPTVGIIDFVGSTASGIATVDVMYSPLVGAPIVVSYEIHVSILSFSPVSPLDLPVGAALTTVTAIGGPLGGTYSGGGFIDPTTGGTFGTIEPTDGTFTFDGASMAGMATIPVTYTPVCSSSSSECNYTINVSNLMFSPASPLGVLAGTGPVVITATGTPPGGTLSIPTFDPDTTGGTFIVGPGTDEFTFDGFIAGGTASADITYTPLPGDGPPITGTYTVEVSSLTFSPASPLDFVAGSPDEMITAVGAPTGGTYSTVVSLPFTDGTTGGTFDSLDPALGTFTFGGATTGGPATIDIVYTPPAGLPNTMTYTVNVTALSPAPASPHAVTTASPDFTITATGSPAGGMISIASISPGTTGGVFSLSSSGPTVGTIDFTSATSTGLASVGITYTPLVGPTITLPYEVTVVDLTFSPDPGMFRVGDTDLSISASGFPTGGTYSTSVSLPLTDPVTGGVFDSLSSTTGSFTFGGATTGGPATIPITYTTLGVSITLPYTVNVTGLTFSPTSPALTTDGTDITITVTGSPMGGFVSIAGGTKHYWRFILIN